MLPSPSNMTQDTIARASILPLLVHAHCTAALPISKGDCRGDMGMGCIISPAMKTETPGPKSYGSRIVLLWPQAYRGWWVMRSDKAPLLNSTCGRRRTAVMYTAPSAHVSLLSYPVCQTQIYVRQPSFVMLVQHAHVLQQPTETLMNRASAPRKAAYLTTRK
jgi:hypothetical protein